MSREERWWLRHVMTGWAAVVVHKSTLMVLHMLNDGDRTLSTDFLTRKQQEWLVMMPGLCG